MEREETLATDGAQISLRSYGRSDSWSPKVLKKERREPSSYLEEKNSRQRK